MRYPRLAARLYNTPLMLSFDKAEIIETVFRAYEEERAADLVAFNRPERASDDAGVGGAYKTAGGIAVLPIYGTLVQRAGPMDAESGMTGYDATARLFAAAQADKDVRGIMLEFDSPGGEVAGVFDLAQQIRASSKPVHAYANEAAFSSAYLLASAAQRLSMPVTARVGSVGVLAMHRDVSVADAKRGIKYTPIFAGALKTDGNPHAPLTAETRARVQSEVDRIYQMLVGTVAENRNIGFDVVAGTEAGLLTPGEAIDLGMADSTGSFNEAMAALADAVSTQSYFYGHRAGSSVASATPNEGISMVNATNNPAAAAVPDQSEVIAQARAEGAQQAQAENASAVAAAETAAQERIAAILNHPEADGRRKLAEHFAFKTKSTVDEVAAILAIAPKDAAAAPSNLLAAAMSGVANPKVGADANAVDGEETAHSVAARILAAGKGAKLKAVK